MSNNPHSPFTIHHSPFFTFTLLAAMILLPTMAHAANIPTLSFSLGDSEDPDAWFTGLKIIAMLTVLTLAPSILVMMTSFTRILIVFAFLRQALGTQQSPPNQILIGLALFLTLFIMMPVWQKIDTEALTPYLNEDISQSVAIDRGIAPLRSFMLKHSDLYSLCGARFDCGQRADEYGYDDATAGDDFSTAENHHVRTN